MLQEPALTAALPETDAANPAPWRGALGAALAILLTGLVLIQFGFAWDARWHMRWVRDAFWMPPHIVVYAAAGIIVGSLAGIVSRLTRSGAPFAPATWLRLRAPRGVLVGAAGAAALAACGPADQAWHAAFGQDFGLWSPPHLAINLSITTIIVGATLALSDYRRMASSRTWRRLAAAGMLLTLGMLFNSASTVTLQAATPAVRTATPAGPLLHAALTAATVPIAVIAARMALGRAAGALAALGTSLLLRLTGSIFAGVALGLSVRLAGGSLGQPRTLTAVGGGWGWLFLALYLQGLVVALALTGTGRNGVTLRRAVVAGMIGAVAALLLGLAGPGVRTLLAPGMLRWAAALALPLGAAGGWLGYKFGALLARSADAVPSAPEPADGALAVAPPAP